jgi:copper transport protein
LTTTLYGRVLLVKLGLVLAVCACGLLNAMLLHPTVAAPLAWLLRRPQGWTPCSAARLPTLILTEASVALLVLLATSVVTAAPPPRGPEFTVRPDAVPTVLSQSVDDLMVTLSVKPNRPGPNVFTVFAASTRRPPPAEIMRVILRFTSPNADVGRVSAIATAIERDRFQVGGSYLSLAGPWRIDVVVRRKGVEDSIAPFGWTVAPPGALRPVVISKTPLGPMLTGAAVGMLVTVLCVAGLAWLGLGKGAARRSPGAMVEAV